MGSDMETCRPSNANEEELQLQLALALSKQEAEEKEKLEERDDQRLQLAINQSQHVPPTGEPTLFDVASSGVKMPAQDTLDPFGSTSVAVPIPPVSQPDPWSSGTTATISTPSNPWETCTVPQLPMETTQNLFGASNGTSAVGAMVGTPDPWGTTPVPAATTMAPPPNDPWGEGNTFPAAVVSQSQGPWELTQTESFSAFNQTNTVQQPLDPYNLPNQGQLPEHKKQPDAFLDNRVSNLVNLDLLTKKPDPVINPFLSSQPSASRSTNPFVQDKPQAPTLNQLREQPVAVQSSMPGIGGEMLLPAPLIPDSGSSAQNTAQSNPFL